MPTAADVLAMRIGRFTIAEHLAQAVAVGRLIAKDDGTWEIPAEPQRGPSVWISGPVAAPFSCRPLKRFLFEGAYGKGCVPLGCQSCYKVKIAPKTLRQLMAVQDLAKPTSYAFKCGLDLGIRYSSGVYAAFFYLDGLDRARTAFAELRGMVDESPALGPDTPMLIKRGCTEYEVHCGPSDAYPIAPAEVEDWLLAHVTVPPSAKALPKGMTFLHWIQTAFQLGDETYLDFTHGRRPYPKVVTYAP
jgi:hypothetical protein